MAFLDNSGDIILDAVLTELGRKRMADGDFNITQFAFGDDTPTWTVKYENYVPYQMVANDHFVYKTQTINLLDATI